MEQMHTLLSQLWSVWFFLLFTGILLWALWPSRRRRLEQHALIPLADGSPSTGPEH